MPSQTFSHRATTSAAIEDVWAALDLPETWEAIGVIDRVFDPIVDSQGRLRAFSFDTVAGGKKYVGEATPSERVEGREMAWHVESTEVKGTLGVVLERAESGTIIDVSLEVQGAGLLGSMFLPVIAGALRTGLPKSVEEFAASFEG